MESVGVGAERAATGVATGAASGFADDDPPDARRVESAVPQARTRVKASEAAPNVLIGGSMGVTERGRDGGCRWGPRVRVQAASRTIALVLAQAGKIATTRRRGARSARTMRRVSTCSRRGLRDSITLGAIWDSTVAGREFSHTGQGSL